ncbi:MAG: hypothetical protein ACJAUH_001075 [Saprospiraceae bacterium]|jgi:hypothetical protein
MDKLTQPFSNVQMELLKVFSYNLENSELLELKEVIANYFAQRAIKAANKVWDEKGWTDDDVDRMLNTKMKR